MDQSAQRFTGRQVVLFLLAAITLTVITTIFTTRVLLSPRPFVPVTLTAGEQQQLAAKLEKLGHSGTEKSPQVHKSQPPKSDSSPQVHPEPYSERKEDRSVYLSQRELNSLLADNTDLAQRVAIDLAKDLVSLNMLLPVDPDFPVLGGKTLHIRAGVELAYREGRPIVIFRGISVMGIPLPKAWLGGMKNIDLVNEFGNEQGFWKGFADGVESLEVDEGRLRIVLRE